MATFSNAFVKNVDTAELSVFTSNSDSTIVLSILCANINGSSAADITVQRKGSGGTDKGYLEF
jgi:hypothetical protein